MKVLKEAELLHELEVKEQDPGQGMGEVTARVMVFGKIQAELYLCGSLRRRKSACGEHGEELRLPFRIFTRSNLTNTILQNKPS